MIIGAFTLLKHARYTREKNDTDFVGAIAKAYVDILVKFGDIGGEWVQFDEPYLVEDLTDDDISLFKQLYSEILPAKGVIKVLL